MDIPLDRKTQQARCACGKQGLYNSVYSHSVRSKDPRCQEPLMLLGVTGGAALSATPEPSAVSGERSEADERPDEEEAEAKPGEPLKAVPKPDNGAGLQDGPGPTYFKYTGFIPVQMFNAFDMYRNRLTEVGIPNFDGDFMTWMCQMTLDDLRRLGFKLEASLEQLVEG